MQKGLVIISSSVARDFECTFSINVNVGFIIQFNYSTLQYTTIYF